MTAESPPALMVNQVVRIKDVRGCRSGEADWLHSFDQIGRIGVVRHHWRIERPDVMPHADEHEWFVTFYDEHGLYTSGSSFRSDELEVIEP